MPTKEKETTRRNGYYQYKDRQFPSVSTILKSAGNPGGLINWAAQQGGMGVIWGLAGIKNSQELEERLKSPAAIEWAKEQAMIGMCAERDRTASFGKLVHFGIEAELKHDVVDFSGWNDDMKKALDTFIKWETDTNVDVVAVEAEVFSPIHEFAGRLDAVLKIDEEVIAKLKPYLTKGSAVPVPGFVISDFKTGSMYPKSQSVQLAAYRQAYLETYSRECNGGMIINIKRDAPEKISCHYFSEVELAEAFEKGFLPAYQVWNFLDSPLWWNKQLTKGLL